MSMRFTWPLGYLPVLLTQHRAATVSDFWAVGSSGALGRCAGRCRGLRGTARRSRNQSRAMAVPAMLEHGRDARGTKSSRVMRNLGTSNIGRIQGRLVAPGVNNRIRKYFLLTD